MVRKAERKPAKPRRAPTTQINMFFRAYARITYPSSQTQSIDREKLWKRGQITPGVKDPATKQTQQPGIKDLAYNKLGIKDPGNNTLPGIKDLGATNNNKHNKKQNND